MREILFRGKRVADSKWVYGCLLNNTYGASKPVIISDSSYTDDNRIANDDWEFVIPETVGQYTGVTDKNDRKIFEGDILAIKFYPRYVERVSWDGKPDAIAKVFWDFSAFRLRAKNDVDIRFADFCDICFKETEIIANIHDNPELLNKR